ERDSDRCLSLWAYIARIAKNFPGRVSRRHPEFAPNICADERHTKNLYQTRRERDEARLLSGIPPQPTSRNRPDANGASTSGNSPCMIAGARASACAAESVTPLWHVAPNTPGYRADCS